MKKLMTLRLVLLVFLGVWVIVMAHGWRKANWPKRVLWCIWVVGASLWLAYWDVPMFRQMFPVFAITICFAMLIINAKERT